MRQKCKSVYNYPGLRTAELLCKPMMIFNPSQDEYRARLVDRHSLLQHFSEHTARCVEASASFVPQLHQSGIGYSKSFGSTKYILSMS
jgi:hypothetical protein